VVDTISIKSEQTVQSERIIKKVKKNDIEIQLFKKVNTNIEFLIKKTPPLEKLGGLNKFID